MFLLKHWILSTIILLNQHTSRLVCSEVQSTIAATTSTKDVNISLTTNSYGKTISPKNIKLNIFENGSSILDMSNTILEPLANTKIRTYKRKTKLRKTYQFGHRLNPYFLRSVAIYLLLIIIVAVLCNSILIFSIIWVRNLHSYMHFLLINMAVGDIITAIGTIPFDVDFLLKGYFSRNVAACGLMQTIFFISLPSSVLCLSLITAERFITIVFSLQEIITKRRLINSVIVMWVYTIASACFPLIYQSDAVRVKHGYCWLKFPIGYQVYQVTANFLIPTAFIIVVYVKLFMISCAHANKTAKTINTIGTMLMNPTDGNNENEGHEQCKKSHKLTCYSMFYRNLKASKRIALLVGVFLFCWLPFIILSAINYECRCLPREVTWLSNAINYSSVAINPLLYGLLNKQIRKEVSRRAKRLKDNFLMEHSFSRTGSRNFSLTRQTSRSHCTKASDQIDNEESKSRKVTETELIDDK